MPTVIPAGRLRDGWRLNTNKYRAERCGFKYPECGRHDSLGEHQRAMELGQMQAAGLIYNLREHWPVYELATAVTLDGRKRPPLRYTPDFTYWTADQQFVVEDWKGVLTEAFKIRRHLMKANHNIEVQVMRGRK